MLERKILHKSLLFAKTVCCYFLKIPPQLVEVTVLDITPKKASALRSGKE
jgi:hypothetical protein